MIKVEELVLGQSYLKRVYYSSRYTRDMKNYLKRVWFVRQEVNYHGEVTYYFSDVEQSQIGEAYSARRVETILYPDAEIMHIWFKEKEGKFWEGR